MSFNEKQCTCFLSEKPAVIRDQPGIFSPHQKPHKQFSKFNISPGPAFTKQTQSFKIFPAYNCVMSPRQPSNRCLCLIPTKIYRNRNQLKCKYSSKRIEIFLLVSFKWEFTTCQSTPAALSSLLKKLSSPYHYASEFPNKSATSHVCGWLSYITHPAAGHLQQASNPGCELSKTRKKNKTSQTYSYFGNHLQNSLFT